MISMLKGVVVTQQDDHVVLLVGGCGFQVQVPENLILTHGTECLFYIYFHWNQENGPSLFGFLSAEQRELFALLITVSGIGPRMALALISAFPVTTLLEALMTGNISLLSSVSGIGRKKAETLVLHLKEKAEKFITPLKGSESSGSFAHHLKDLSDALMSLGYSRTEIMVAFDQLRTHPEASTWTFDQLLRKSLQALAKK